MFEMLAAPARTFIFIDPPYMKEVRSDRRNIYTHEWDEGDHVKFLSWLHCSPASAAMVMITHPRNLLYENSLQGWNTVDFSYQTRGGIRQDCIWFNYTGPEVLHDYRYVGNTRTERQVIDRRIVRLIEKLAALPGIERNAAIAAIHERFK